MQTPLHVTCPIECANFYRTYVSCTHVTLGRLVYAKGELSACPVVGVSLMI